MRGKILKNALIISVIAAMLASTFAVTPSFAQREANMIVGPTIDDTMGIGSTFTKEIIVFGDIAGMLGYDLQLTYDPTILKVNGFASNAPFTLEWFASTATLGDVMLSYSFPIPEPVGLPTSDPVIVATIDFEVLAYGVSDLALRDVKIVDVDAYEFPTTLYSACFSNVWPGTVMPEDIYVGMTGAFIGKRNFDVSVDGNIQTLTGQIENKGMYQTRALVKFRVLDSMGGVVAELESAGVQIIPGQVLRLPVDLDVTQLDMPASYIVEIHIEYVGFTGWIVGRHGAANAAKSTKAAFFTLEP